MSICLKSLYLAVITAFFVSCTTSKKITSSSSDLEGMQHTALDTIMVQADDDEIKSENQPAYRPSEDRVWDLLHTSLDLSFDWVKESVTGRATLTLAPVFYTQTSLHIDAIQFNIHRIAINGKGIEEYHNTGTEIIIPLSSAYKKDQELKVEIEYTATPRPTTIKEDAAITSNKGLFFIDPQDTIPELPRQIWSQGETENNSLWFPTLDQPNERGTQEIFLTVEDSMMTLSNGLLISSTPVAGGMRRDHWKLDLPIAPYLVMVAVGQWDKVTEYWRGRPVEYYVDLGYGPSAKAIFANTPEMIEFFSTKLQYDFVWPKYAQIVVKNFVSGAMENATAVVFSDFIEFHKDEIFEDGANDYIVAHELFHHWFGDLVTCESWANLTLNEGFANYAEYLWQEYKYGRERADISRLQELSGYFDQTEYRAHPLIHYQYEDRDDLFDAHSYNKGGLVLHMLRSLVGEEAFFASLQQYLKQHAYQAVEVDDLRQAFEEVTGKDLHWFFDQWYFAVGHPIVDIHHSFDPTNRKLNIAFTQTQDSAGFKEVFLLPIDIAIFHQDSTVEIQKILVDKKAQSFSFELTESPLAVVIDPNDNLLAVIHHDIPESEYGFRATADLSINHRISAFRLMETLDPSVMRMLMKDTSYTMRAMLISYLAEKQDTTRLYELSLNETNPEILYYIVESISEPAPWKAREVALRLLAITDKTPMIYSGLKAVAEVDIDEAIRQVAHFQNNLSPAIYAAQASILVKKGNAMSLDFFASERAAQITDEYLEEFIGAMTLFMSRESSAIQDKGLAMIDSDFFLHTSTPEYRRFYLITGMLQQYAEEKDISYKSKILTTMKSLYNKETSAYVRAVLKEGLGKLLD